MRTSGNFFHVLPSVRTEGVIVFSSVRALLKGAMSATESIGIMLVEDHAAFRQALAFLLSDDPQLEVVAQAGSLAEAEEQIEALPDERLLDVAVLDLGLPDGDGRELIGRLRLSNPAISVAVLSASIEAGHIEEILRAGADAVLEKVAAPQTVAEEVRRLAGG
jgi:DNA-binding NarL/FixJ family response regulator